MKFLRLTAFPLFLIGTILTLGACEKSAEAKKGTLYTRTGIIMSGAQETPANPSNALGSLDISYIRGNKVLNYKFTWSALSDTITGIHIHGLAPEGFAAGILQNILTTRNETVFPFRGGSYSGNLQVDEVAVKEENVLNGLYYVNIHTKTYPNGEIRGQIRFQ